MKNVQQFLQRPWLYVILVIIGVSLKFYNLDKRFFWYDEICTIQHTSGNQIVNIPVNEIKNIHYYSDQLRLKKQNLTIGSEIQGLFSTTNLNPLHYTFLMIWYRVVGDDPIHYRLFSVFIFILTLPFLFLLSKKLFESDLAGWIAVSLYSLSPFFHFFALEARYYIFWAFILIVLHYLFLIAVSQNKLKWWIGYSIVGILSLYASILSGLVVLGHFIYLLIIRRDLWYIYSINALMIFLGYLPWLIFLLNNKSKIFAALAWHSWFGSGTNIFTLVVGQLMLMAASFVSLNGVDGQLAMLSTFDLQGRYIQFCISLLLVALIVYSIIYVIKKSPPKVSFFLILITLPQFLFFIISDLIRGTGGSLVYRYHIITFTGILFFIVFLISKKIQLGKIIYSGIFIGIIIFGFISIFINSQNRCWDTPIQCEEVIQTAQFTSALEKPLVIIDYSIKSEIVSPAFMTFINECKSDNIDILIASPDIEHGDKLLTGNNYSDIVVSSSSDGLVKNLKSQFGERMDSVKMKGVFPTWLIKLK